MRKSFLLGVLAVLFIPIVPLVDWVNYRDQKFFITPISYSGRIPIRKDIYGDGHFGTRRKGGRIHKGLDIYAPLDTEVKASKGGRARRGFVENGLGNYVIIKHSQDYLTLYGHLSRFEVKDNQRVRQGAVIGYVGKTGNAKYKKIKPHLHFEIRKGGEHLDPLYFLK